VEWWQWCGAMVDDALVFSYYYVYAGRIDGVHKAIAILLFK